jgi:ribonuclease J
MKVCIRRGAKQIGGTCIELESQGKRLVLDIGQPLDSPDAESTEMPAVPGLKEADASLLGIVVSHPHMDHYGLAFRVPKKVPFLMGAATQRILEAAAVFTPCGGTFEKVIHLDDCKPIELGSFQITPFLMDHSAYDSYALLIEGDGKRLFYTGDLRAHGRKAKLFERLVAHPPRDVDVLLMEGTTITRTGTDKGFPTEADLEKKFVNIFRKTTGMPLVWCSGQNIDRLVTVFRACKRSGRNFIIDMYTAHILKATGNPKLPQADWDGVKVFLPEFQKQRIKRQRDFDIADLYKLHRIYPEHLAVAAKDSVMLFRPSMQTDVESAGCLDGACLVYSMWDGYLAKDETQPFLVWLKERGIPLVKCHTSGHASVKDLQRLRAAFQTAVVIPIHTEQPSLYRDVFGNVRVCADGAWWAVDQHANHQEDQDAH